MASSSEEHRRFFKYPKLSARVCCRAAFERTHRVHRLSTDQLDHCPRRSRRGEPNSEERSPSGSSRLRPV